MIDKQKRGYLMVKVATEQYQLNPQFLSGSQRQKVNEQVNRLLEIQAAILMSQEAQGVFVSDRDVEQAYHTCRSGYDDEAQFAQALAGQSLTEQGLRRVLYDELICDQVLAQVAESVPPLDRGQARQYYEQHPANFAAPQRWEISQILITINDDYVENRRDQAYQRICEVYQKTATEDFSALALRYSECPSALENGSLGWCDASQLYPQISAILPVLVSGQVSEPIETEIGFHLVQYHQCREAHTATFEEVLPYLEEKHLSRARQYLQKQWLRQLLDPRKAHQHKEAFAYNDYLQGQTSYRKRKQYS
ncbi:peptidylprolyl isomerase [Vibrio sp. PP-XX7]